VNVTLENVTLALKRKTRREGCEIETGLLVSVHGDEKLKIRHYEKPTLRLTLAALQRALNCHRKDYS
jgi:hypothetical protein